jgi:hypothetical protein
LLFLDQLMTTSNIDKLVAAKLIELSEIGQKEIDLINALGQQEIDTIVSAGAKFKDHAAAGANLVRVIF